MVRKESDVQLNETGLSKDYNLLCELIKTQAVICVVDTKCSWIRHVCIAFIKSERYEIVYAGNVSKAYEDNEESFIQECQRLNLAFYDPNPWQPIETAPRDGTPVLVIWKTGIMSVATWRLPMRGEPQNESHYEYEWRDTCGCWATPTHWMPLPPPITGDK